MVFSELYLPQFLLKSHDSKCVGKPLIRASKWEPWEGHVTMPSHSHSHFFVFYTVVCLIITPILIQSSSVWYRQKGIGMLFQTRYSKRLSAPNWSINQLNSGGKLGEAATAPHLAGHMIWQLCKHMALTFPVKTTVILCQSDNNSLRYTPISVAASCWLSSA